MCHTFGPGEAPTSKRSPAFSTEGLPEVGLDTRQRSELNARARHSLRVCVNCDITLRISSCGHYGLNVCGDIAAGCVQVSLLRNCRRPPVKCPCHPRATSSGAQPPSPSTHAENVAPPLIPPLKSEVRALTVKRSVSSLTWCWVCS